MIVQRVMATMEDIELNVNEITLLSVDEATALPVDVHKCKDDWWLCSPGYYAHNAAFVYGDTCYISSYGYNVKYMLGVRPALKISNLTPSDLQIGDKIKIFNYTWTIIAENLILCDDAVGKSPFRKDWDASDANDYEASDVKRWIEKWYTDQVALTESEDK